MTSYRHRITNTDLGLCAGATITLAFICVYLLELTPLILVIIPVALFVFYFAIRFGEIALYIFILVTVLFNLGVFATAGQDSGITPIQVASAVLLLCIAVIHLLKLKVLQRKELFSENAIVFISLYMCWTILMSIVGILVYGHPPALIIREIVLQLPLIMCPLLIYHYINKSNEKRLLLFIIGIWVLTLGANFIKYQSNITRAYYLYEVGRATTDITLASFALFTLVALATHRKSPNNIFLLAGALFSIAAIVITMFRTLWLTDIVLMVIMTYFFSKRSERKYGVKFLMILTMTVVGSLLFLMLVFPVIELMLRLFFQRFLYSSAVTTDPSLVNRYIEWESILKTISSSFVTGLGYGGQYLTYNWIVGVSYMTGYTHNGYLFLLLRSGIIGFVLLGIGYVLFMKKAVLLLHIEHLTPERRALLKGGLMILIANLVTSITLNALAQREALMWTGVIWGFIILTEKESYQLR